MTKHICLFTLDHFVNSLVKHFASSKEDKKRAYDTLQSVNLASGKVS